ncbi:hypothetical protein [Kibdelosporangium philippinense]
MEGIVAGQGPEDVRAGADLHVRKSAYIGCVALAAEQDRGREYVAAR